METTVKKTVTVETIVRVPVEKAWMFWTTPDHIIQWNNASEDWHTPRAENDLRKGGSFLSRMEAKDGSMGFDFGGVYDEIITHQENSYTMGDGRKVNIRFIPEANGTKVIETFEAENTHSVEMQRAGWQAILDNYKNHAESNSPFN
ncbi:MAG: SRPBCC family protein [Saprospiraceae bacterium]|nr:SRPBCC family protein [Saprospiraceae bacterium]